ncbi:MAG: nicotinate (nicotinamide) nucleotide adenylyltransferase [Prevotellaceae bacterium]|nr:nicotinate (nicotinamide) nucleotide adenylyltransferase [Prevotellaceae bacterium]
MIKTGIFGGSFNPIHKAHVRLARQLLASAGLDEVWFVVSPQNPLKREADLLDDDLRMKMVSMALENEPNLIACDYELHLPKPSYMWKTLQSLASDYKEREFVLLIGADNWLCFDRWYAYQKILDNYRIVIYPREGSPIDESLLPKNVTLVNTELIDISSTEIRERIRKSMPIDDIVPESVAYMIKRNGLYRN